MNSETPLNSIAATQDEHEVYFHRTLYSISIYTSPRRVLTVIVDNGFFGLFYRAREGFFTSVPFEAPNLTEMFYSVRRMATDNRVEMRRHDIKGRAHSKRER